MSIVPNLWMFLPVTALTGISWTVSASELWIAGQRTFWHFPDKMLVSSWAEHLRQYARTTKAETELVQRVWAMHASDEEPIVRHYLQANRLSTPLGFSRFQEQAALALLR